MADRIAREIGAGFAQARMECGRFLHRGGAAARIFDDEGDDAAAVGIDRGTGRLAAQPRGGAGAGADLLDEDRQDAGAQGFADGFIAVELGKCRRPAQAEADIGHRAEAMGEPAAQPLRHVEARTIGGKSRRGRGSLGERGGDRRRQQQAAAEGRPAEKFRAGQKDHESVAEIAPDLGCRTAELTGIDGDQDTVWRGLHEGAGDGGAGTGEPRLRSIEDMQQQRARQGRRTRQNLVVDLFAGPPSSVRMPQRDRYDIDIGAEHTLDRKPAIDRSLMRCRGEKMLAGRRSRDSAARLVRGDQHIGQRPIEERVRDRKRHQFRFGAGSREDCRRAGNSERAQDARADRVEPVVHGKRRRPQQRGERLRGGAIAGKAGGRSGRRREPDFVWGGHDRRAVAIASGQGIGPDALVAAARQHEFELQ